MLRSTLAFGLLLLGVSLLAYGFYLAWPPLGFIACGAAVVAFALTREAGAGA
jgi:membrane protein implicated in regulation of membrane protease activity